ncbi:MAG TPA: DUF3443 family protein [Acidobacteriaceae bacterium]
MRSLFVSILLGSAVLAAGCGGSKGTATSTGTTTTTTGSGANSVTLTVDGGPTATQPGGELYANAAFATATICSPGSTSNCVTIDHLLVDTGSTGLRVFQSAVSSLNLPSLNASNGSPAYDCVSFVDGSYLWGAVQQADVTLGGETASKTPIQVISGTTTGVPSSCSNGSTDNQNTQASLGANGILGVGVEQTDCFYKGGSVCDSSSGLSTPPTPAYYACTTSTSCSPAFVSVANQAANPVALFPSDNNGVIVKLPAVSGSAATLTGSLVFGIGTQSNNQLPSSPHLFTLTCDDFSTTFSGTTFTPDPSTCGGAGSFIDSGSNGLYFPNVTKIPTCPTNTTVGDISGFYCPSSTEKMSATMSAADAASNSVSFSVANAENLFTNTTTDSDAVLPTLGGPNPGGVGFDWGLPFFYGVNLYSAIDGETMPSGTPAAPWWAY